MSVARHTLYNLAGSVAPMVVSIVTVPIYLHLVGPTRYGVLSIVWLFLGYFGLFDPGLSRAATYHIARLHDASAKERGDVFWTALAVNAGFGILGGLVLYVVARPLFMSAFKMPEAMRGEVLACLPWLAASIPVSIISGVLGSVLQAREWFGVSNGISVLTGIFAQVVPLFVAYFLGANLTLLISSVLLCRALSAVPTFLAVAKSMPLGAGGRLKLSLVPTLFSYGGWIAITNLLTPVLTSIDRMVIGTVLSVTEVTYYSVPFNLVSRFSIIPGSLCSSIFPKLSSGTMKSSDTLATDALFALAAVTTPLVVVGALLLPEFLRVWVGTFFGDHSSTVGLILLFGVWFNGLANVPYFLLQARNRPDVAAKLHAAETLPFLVTLWIGVHFFGLVGVAASWTLRMMVDAILLFHITGQMRNLSKISSGVIFILGGMILSRHCFDLARLAFAFFLILLTAIWSLLIWPRLGILIRSQFGRLSFRGAI